MYDQHYWAGRVDDLEIGSAHAPGAPTTDSLVTALDDAMGLAANARALAPAVHTDGVQVAADSLLNC
jgi:vancomycin aglycone glucosyltransferase